MTSVPASGSPKVVPLCGGPGTPMREETELRPKPMVGIGEQPLLRHVMKLYAHRRRSNPWSPGSLTGVPRAGYGDALTVGHIDGPYNANATLRDAIVSRGYVPVHDAAA